MFSFEFKYNYYTRDKLLRFTPLPLNALCTLLMLIGGGGEGVVPRIFNLLFKALILIQIKLD